MDEYLGALMDAGFAWFCSGFPTEDEAFGAAQALVDVRCAADHTAPFAVIGDFVIPPLEGHASRDFQTLHFDFGIPLDPKVDHDVARYTALYVPSRLTGVAAATRLVGLAELLTQRAWPSPSELLGRLIAYGRTHGAWDDARGYTEGSLARMVEAAAASSPLLPSVKLDPDFLCGMEFDSLGSELAFFEGHGLQVKDVEVEVVVGPGQLLVFDNLAVAHGRRGARRPGELHQRVYGHRGLKPAAQRKLRDRVLKAFEPLLIVARS